MKRFFLLIIGALLTISSLNSCGVIFGGSRYQGTIIANGHKNAEIYVDGKKLGSGRATGMFFRNKPLVVEVREEGCPNKTQTFDKTFRVGNFILSAITFGIIGAGIDLGTGASYKPAYKYDSNIQKINNKNYVFHVNYPECK